MLTSLLWSRSIGPYKLGEDEASLPVPAGVVDVEAEDGFLLAEEVVAEVLPDGPGKGEVDALSTAGDVELDVVGVVDEAPEVGGELVCEVLACAGVEVEETNGGASWMYEPSGWTA